MKQAKPIFVILIMMSICCSYSIGQSSSGIGVKASSVHPIGQISNDTMAYLGDIKINPINISQLQFVCDLMASCGLYPTGEGDIKTGAGIYPAGQVNNGEMVYPGGFESDSTAEPINILITPRIVRNAEINLQHTESGQMDNRDHDKVGGNGVGTLSCPDGILSCGDRCCEADQICLNGQCIPPPQKCPPYMTSCGNECCRTGLGCQNGYCVPPLQQCPPNIISCGNKCYGTGQGCQNGQCVSYPPNSRILIRCEGCFKPQIWLFWQAKIYFISNLSKVNE